MSVAIADRNSDLASLALQAGRMGLFDWHLASGQVIGDSVHADLFGTQADAPYPATRVFDAIHPDDKNEVEEEIRKALESDADYKTTFRVVANGETRWLGGRGRVVERDDRGQPVRMIGVNWDCTEEERRERAVASLAREMNHRVNNAFAVIEALLVLGGRMARSVPEFAQTLRAQVHALADTHQLMVGKSLHDHGPYVEVSIADLVQTALREWLETRSDIVEMELDQLYVVPPNRVAGMAMLIYELATNSRRYGVLGPAQGKLRVAVSVDHETCRLTWHERFIASPPPAPSPAASESFGAALLHHCTDVLSATIEQNGRDENGFVFAMHLPVVSDDDGTHRTFRVADLERFGVAR